MRGLAVRIVVRVFFLRCAFSLILIGCACRSDPSTRERSQPSPSPGSQAVPRTEVARGTRTPKSESEGRPHAGEGYGDDQSVTTADGTYVVRFHPRVDAIPLNQPFSLQVQIVPQRKDATDGITVSVDAAMPQHGHGMNTTPLIEPLGDLRFEVTGMLLHMKGFWEVYFDVSRKGVTERAQVRFRL